MLVDKTTQADLSLFHSEEEQSVFFHLNTTQTNGGREYLRQLLSTPLGSIREIEDTQQTIRVLMDVAVQWPLLVSNGTILMIERFFEAQINSYGPHPNHFDTFLYKLVNKSDYSLIKFSVEHALDFVKGLDQITGLLANKPLSRQLETLVTRMRMLLDKPMIQKLMREEKKNISSHNILIYGNFIRGQFKQASFELIDIYSRLDAYLSLALSSKKYGFSFPEFIQSKEPTIQAEGLFHLLLEIPVSYDIKLQKERNFLFLTGANMAGKSTFIKAVGIAVYLAHIGMGVPAAGMQLSYFDGLLSNIQVVDNIVKGESFFFNEVQRIKSTIEKISDGKNWLILIDELFKGTNQQDAVKCSITVIEGLRKMPNALFVLSTHLYEIGEDLKKYGNIQFRYFETSVENDQLRFSYQLKEGISNDRLGYLILRKEGVVALLEKL